MVLLKWDWRTSRLDPFIVKMTSDYVMAAGPNAERWLRAYDDPLASIYTFSWYVPSIIRYTWSQTLVYIFCRQVLIKICFFSCIALSDLTGDGDTKLVVADLGSGNYNMKLRVYKGTQMVGICWSSPSHLGKAAEVYFLCYILSFDTILSYIVIYFPVSA